MKEFIKWEDIDLKGKTSGQIKTKCPSCIDRRSNKADKSLSVNIAKGLANCHYCEAVSFKESVEEKTKVDFKLPKQDWKNYTTLSDKMVKWLEEERKISQSTAINLGWTEENYYQPQLNSNVNNLVFNFFEGETLVNKKYRSGNKKFTQSAGTKSIFYNINAAIGQKEIYIVEGEFDVAALYEVGIKNAVSVPNGANDNDDFWKNSEPYIKDIDSFIIAVDNDEKGNILKDKIAQRLGRYRCTFIEWEGKDANDDLKSLKLTKTAFNKKRFPVSGTFKASDLKDRILDLYKNGLPKTIYPKHKCFGKMGEMYSMMRGQLTVGTGIPSHGKSNFTDWYVLNLLKENDFKASWFSPEHSPMELYHTNLMEKVIGRNFWGDIDLETKRKIRDGRLKNHNIAPRVKESEINQYIEWADEKIYLTGCEGSQLPTWDWLLDKFKEQMYSFGIDIFVIDAFNKVLLPKGNRLEQINVVLTKLTHFAQSNNVMVILVAHPTKMQKNEQGIYSVPTLYDVSGSADFRNQTHCGYSIYRTWADDNGQEAKTTFYNMKTKFNFQGDIGASIDFNYCEVNGRYYVDGIDEPLWNLITDKETDHSIKPLPMINPEEAFEEVNDDDFKDCPF